MGPLLPSGMARRLLAVAKRPLVASMDPSAYEVLERPISHDGFASLAGHRYCLLVTYKRDGTPVPAPVWFGLDGERLYVWTEINAYKAKRLARDPRALIAPCGATGKPLGDPVEATGRVLSTEDERRHAARTLHRQWGLGRRIFEKVSRPVTEVHYLEFVPATV